MIRKDVTTSCLASESAVIGIIAYDQLAIGHFSKRSVLNRNSSLSLSCISSNVSQWQRPVEKDNISGKHRTKSRSLVVVFLRTCSDGSITIPCITLAGGHYTHIIIFILLKLELNLLSLCLSYIVATSQLRILKEPRVPGENTA